MPGNLVTHLASQLSGMLSGTAQLLGGLPSVREVPQSRRDFC